MQDVVAELRHQLVVIQREAGAFRLAADAGLLLLFLFRGIKDGLHPLVSTQIFEIGQRDQLELDVEVRD